MMILKNPMKLQSLLVLNTHPDMLGDKIRANYQLIGTDMTSADLLHMTMQEPALYVNLENNQTLAVENHIDTKNALKLDLVNQLLNRIMLINSPQFTYQDEVFVTSILQKIGITNVDEFINQVQRHIERSALLTGLLRQYAQYDLKHYHQMDASKFSEVLKKEDKSDYYLHNTIFKRLLTVDCNHIMYTYNSLISNKTTSDERIRSVTWIEQADAIALAQYRERLFDLKNPVIWQEYMNYEIKPLEKEELTERRILQRMASAILENIIQMISYEQQHKNRNIVWKNYTSAFYQSAVDVIKRFQDFQNGKVMDVRLCDTYEQGMAQLVQDEQELIQMLQYFETDYTEQSVFSTASINHISGNQYDAVFETIMRSILENQYLQKLLAGRMQIEERFANQTELLNTYLENKAAYMSEQQKFQQAYQEFIQKSGDAYLMEDQTANNIDLNLNADDMNIYLNLNTNTKTYTDENIGINIDTWQKAQETLDKNAASMRKMMSMERHSEQSMQTHQVNEYIQEWYQDQSSQNDNDYHVDYSGQSNQNSSYNYMETFLNKYNHFVSDQSVPLMENAELLEQINQHNLYMKTQLDSKDTGIRKTLKHIGVDKEKARRDALRALENPQVVLDEIYENAAAIEAEIPEEIERILSITDEHTRMFYEELLGYRAEETTERVEVSQQQLAEILGRINSTNNQIESVYHQSDKQISDSQSNTVPVSTVGSSQYSPDYDSHMISNTKVQTADIFIENTGNLYSSINVESADGVYNGTNNKHENVTYRSANNENTNVTYSDINNENADVTYSSIKNGNASVMYSSANKETADVVYNSMKSEDADIAYSSIKSENASVMYSSANKETADVVYSSIKNENANVTYSSINKETADIAHYSTNKENVDVAYNSIKNENADAVYNSIKNDSINNNIVYHLIKQIKENENRLYQEIILKQNDSLYERSDELLYRQSESYNSILADSAKFIASQIAVHAADSNVESSPKEEHVAFVHKREEVLPEEAAQYAAEQNITQKQIVQEQKRQEQEKQEQIAQKQLQEIKRELITQSEAHIAQLVSRSLKTQVHTISDRVYIELERRLKNEQRRRGY